MKKYLFILTGILYSLPFLLISQIPYAEVKHQEIYNNSYDGSQYSISGDFDQDGINEIAITTRIKSKSIVTFIEPNGITYKEYAFDKSPDTALRGMEYDSKNNKIYYLEANGIYSYCPITNEKEEVFINFPDYKKRIELINSLDQILVQTINKLYLITLGGEIIKEQEFSDINNFEIFDINGDNTPELIINYSNSSEILNLQTFENLWAFDYSFGNSISSCDVNDDGINEIIGRKGKKLTCYNIPNDTILWNFDSPHNIQDIISSKSTTTEKPIILSSTYKGISSISPSDGSVIWRKQLTQYVNFQLIQDINNNGHDDVSFFTITGFHIMDIQNFNKWDTHAKYGRPLLDLIYPKDETANTNYALTSDRNHLHKIFKANNDSILKKHFHIDHYQNFVENSSIQFNGHQFYMFRDYLNQVLIYRNNLYTPYYRFTNSPISRNIQFLPTDPSISATPLIAGFNENNKFLIYSFSQDEHILLYESPSSSVKSKLFKVGNYDLDESDEVVILYENAVLVYDIETNQIQNQIPVDYNKNHNILEVVDLKQDGTYYIIIGGKNDENLTDIQIINMDDNSIEEVILLDTIQSDLKAIKYLNIDDTKEPEIIFVSDKLYVYDALSNNIKAEIKPHYVTEENESFDINGFIIEDINHDNQMDILMSYQYGFARIQINKTLLDTKLPQIVHYKPSENDIDLAINHLITIYFSEPILESTLENITIHDEDGNLENFEVILLSDLKTLQIIPKDSWSIDKKIKIVIPNTLTDLSGNPLDGNKNGIADLENDTAIIYMNIGHDYDDKKPYFKNLDSPFNIHPSQKLSIQGTASDFSDMISSNIREIKYSINNKSNIFEEGRNIPSIDKNFDSHTEDFSLYISTDSLSLGDHVVYLATVDECQNKSAIDSLKFTIIPEAKENWSLFSKDVLNTSYAPSSTINYPFIPKYTIENTNKSLSAAIIVNDKLIYSSKNRIWVREINTGELIWQKEYQNSYVLSTPAYKYGNLYVQVGNHEKSSLKCLSISDGSMIWSNRYNVQWQKMTGPIISEGKVIILEGPYDTILGVYDAYDGELIWQNSLGTNNLDNWNPAIYNGKIYGLGDDFCVFDLHTGEVIKKIYNDELLSTNNYSSKRNPILDTLNNQIILTSKKNIFALDLDSYSLNWELPIETFGAYNSSHALAENFLYVNATDQIMKIATNNGEIIWKNEDYSGDFQPVVSDSIVVFSSKNSLLVMDTKTDTIKGQFNAGGHISLYKDYLVLTEENGNSIYVFESLNNAKPLQTEMIVVDSIDCNGNDSGTIKVLVSGNEQENFTYKWKDSEETGNTRTNLVAGTYVVTVSNDFLKTAVDSITLTEPELLTVETNSTNDINGQNNGTATVIPMGGTPPYTYNWQDFPGLSIPSFSNLKAGNYIVEIQDKNGCTEWTTIIVYAVTGTNEEDYNQVILYPTLSNGKFHVKVNENWIGSSYKLFNSLGKMLKEGSIRTSNSTFNEDIPTGNYFLYIQKDEKEVIFRFQVIH